ncbi:MAG: DEAD/DEAH box helicase [Bdellovibrionales bacterium]|nr:DEAD/DEAH box helicase [Bdellovibrionales bacterium]
MKSFNELNLHPALAKAITGMSFTTPTPIQAQAIPIALKRNDILACAQTGSGKTAAFAIPILSHLLEEPGSMALVLVPTRELSSQVTEVFRQLALHLPMIRVVSLIGGVSMQPQLRALSKGYHVIVATPGRLVDHLERKSATLKNLKTVTLDEADRMLDMGFAPQLKQIFRHLPEKRQTLLFSATLPNHIQDLARNLLVKPERITIGAVSSAVPTIQQASKHVGQTEKNNTILDEINGREGSILIFGRTQRRVDRLARYLESYGVDTGRIHGGRTQGQRNRALEEFKTEKTRVLVATDIAARGIDIDHVAHVINYDLPQVPEDYIHRIGRTARAGRKGEALSLISPEEKPLWKEIEKLLKTKPGTVVQARQAFQPAQ